MVEERDVVLSGGYKIVKEQDRTPKDHKKLRDAVWAQKIKSAP